MRSTIPFYDQLISLINYGKGRTSIPEYPKISFHIRTAIEVFQGIDPKIALDKYAEE